MSSLKTSGWCPGERQRLHLPYPERHRHSVELFPSRDQPGHGAGHPVAVASGYPRGAWSRAGSMAVPPAGVGVGVGSGWGAGEKAQASGAVPAPVPHHQIRPCAPTVWSAATPGCCLLSRPGAQRLILEMTCPLSCCYHIGVGEGGEVQAGKGIRVPASGGELLPFLLCPCSPGLVGPCAGTWGDPSDGSGSCDLSPGWRRYRRAGVDSVRLVSG